MSELLIPRGTPGDSVPARFHALLAARGIAPSRVSVAFVDENGPKGARASAVPPT